MFRIPLQVCAVKNVPKVTFTNLSKYSSIYNLPEEADVVIIGGGNLGCNILYQLSKRGVNTVLLEKNKITSGTTWHSNGLFWRLRPNDVDIQLLSCLPTFVREIEEKTDLRTGFEINGGLFIARTEERLREYRRLNTIGKYFNIDSQIISSVEASKLHPLLNPNSFTSALYSPNDGRIDPSMFCAAIAKGASKYGGKIVENCAVLDILTSYKTGFKKIKSVKTELGTIKTNCVVNAAGVWSTNISKMVDLEIPLTAFKHAYIITDAIAGAKSAPNVRDHDASICFKSLGETLYIGGYEMNPVFVNPVPTDFSFSLYDLDWDLFTVHMEKACELSPSLRNAGIKSNVYGPEAFTPDHKPLLGEDPRLTGFYYACGFNAAGMMLGTGCAEQIAAWIIKGRPELPMANYDIRRFTPFMQTNRTYINEASHESYATNYGIVFPNTQPLAARNLKIEAIHQLLIEQGAVMEQSQSWERPSYFLKNEIAPVLEYDWYGCYNHTQNLDKRYVNQLEADSTFDFFTNIDLIKEESLSARKNVALFSLSSFGKYYLTGKDAEKAANWLFTAETITDKVVQSCVLNDKGGIEGYVNVLSLNPNSDNLLSISLKGKSYYITTEGSTSSQVFYHLTKEIQKQNLNVQLIDVTENKGIFSIQGPNSQDLMETILDGSSDLKNVLLGESRIVKVNGNLCQLIRLSHIGEMGFELHVLNEACTSVYNKILKVGNEFKLKLAGYRAFTSLNCEKGNYIWNSDITSEENPVEANLGQICKSDIYLGKDVVERAKRSGIKKIRTIFTLDKKISLWGLEIIWRNDKIVGFLKRGNYGHYLQKSIGIGYVHSPDDSLITNEFIKNGKFEIEVMGQRYPAGAFLKSPFDPKNQRLSGKY
ncbi:hypothetical protein RN001_003183 [Aquatica leii]|uniref:Sarcosine dehydrogenase n=1 Tax=Aquatica leii TaxID=1421715 RepID=A0AAN7Q9A8_9COLE|nr:hypothetical protein RN001_003183 [Aquatica leii]